MADKPTTIRSQRKARRNAIGRLFVEQKLNNWVGYVIMGLAAVGLAYLMAAQMIAGIGVVVLFVGIFVVSVCAINPLTGLLICIAYSFFICDVSRMFFDGELQVGIFWDVLLLATLFGILGKRERLKEVSGSFFRSPVVIWSLAFAIYFSLQFFNPLAHSFDGWYGGFRKMIENLILLYVAYNVLSTYKRVKRFVSVLFVLAVLIGFYACIQQWFGLTAYNRNWVTEDKNRFGLIFIMGDFRKFSSLPDPTSFGMVMAFCAAFFALIAINEKDRKRRWRLLAGVLVMVLGMSYSGTRTANVMLLASFGIFILLSLNKKSTRIFAGISVVLFLLLLRLPIYSNQTLNRFRSSFEGKSDGSFEVRELARKYIQPYMYTHPFGGGIATTGNVGLKLNPGHTLAGFQTDDGYLKFALETGTIGLIILCILNFTILRSAVRAYFQSDDDRYKTLYSACLAGIFAFMLAELAQECMGQVPCDAIFYPAIAIILRLGLQEKERRLARSPKESETAVV